MSAKITNALVTTFPGLDLPATLCIPTPSITPISDLVKNISSRLPSQNEFLLSSFSNQFISPLSTQTVASLLDSPDQLFVNLRLSTCLYGGKGGFGSQLRAAGGRMSSRKKRRQGEEQGSSRNLDGRRLRTVTEAKALAEYLAMKPDMDKKEKEERRRRWEQVVELAERKEDEARRGGKARLDGRWVEAKEDAAEKTREAVIASLKSGDIQTLIPQHESDQSSLISGNSSDSESDIAPESSTEATKAPNRKPCVFFGWDEDDEEESLSDMETPKVNSLGQQIPDTLNYENFKGKGKGKRNEV